MSSITKIVKEEVKRLENTLKTIDAFLEKAPEGCLKWQNKNGKTYYTHQVERQSDEFDNETCNDANEVRTEPTKGVSKWIRQYIKKQDISLAKILAQKHYYLTIRPILEKNLNELNRFLKSYKSNELDEIYDSLCDERKRIVVPIRMSVKEKIRKWENEVYEENTMFPEKLRYETEQGEFVRSKSEAIIANILYQNRNHILYKYERPLEIIEKGRTKIIYPDFTILNIHTGKRLHWEHAGLLDNSYYASEFVKKINNYIENDLLPGRDVIITFESQGNGLDIGVVKKLIKEIINFRLN